VTSGAEGKSQCDREPVTSSRGYAISGLEKVGHFPQYSLDHSRHRIHGRQVLLDILLHRHPKHHKSFDILAISVLKMSTSSTAPTLLTLPAEIRLKIYSYLLPPPNDTEGTVVTLHSNFWCTPSFSSYRPIINVSRQTTLHRSAVAPLVLTSKLLRQETLGILAGSIKTVIVQNSCCCNICWITARDNLPVINQDAWRAYLSHNIEGVATTKRLWCPQVQSWLYFDGNIDALQR
jgi:hypothetical protein